MADVVYEERATSPRAWQAVYAGTGLLVLLALLGQDTVVEGLLVGALLSALIGGIALVTLWSMERYGRIRLTREELRVGRHAVPLPDVDPRMLLAQAAAVPELAARWPQAAGVDLSDAPMSARPPVMGGAYSEPMGHRSLYLLTRDKQYRRVPTKRPDALLAALLELTVPG